jgi:hypothetical protein
MPRPSAKDAYERRVNVFRMGMRGLNKTVISRELGVSRQTITNDFKWNRDHFSEMAAHSDRNEVVGEAIAKLEEMEKEAMRQYEETENPHAKNNFLLTALNACEKRIKMMMDTGILQRAAIDMNLNVDYSKLTTEELLTKRNEVLTRLRTFGVPSVSEN